MAAPHPLGWAGVGAHSPPHLIVVQVLRGFSETLAPVCVADLRGSGRCPPGQAAVGVLGTGGVECATFPDAAVWQRRLRLGCPPEASLRTVDAAGNVVCQPDVNTVATAAQFQARPAPPANNTVSCATGGSSQAWLQTISAAGGAAACYTPPAISPAVYQVRANNTCTGADVSVRALGISGAPTCQKDFRTPEVGAAVYIHWGQRACPSPLASTVYTGWIGGGHFTHNGAGHNQLCMARGAEYDILNAGNQDGALIYRTGAFLLSFGRVSAAGQSVTLPLGRCRVRDVALARAAGASAAADRGGIVCAVRWARRVHRDDPRQLSRLPRWSAPRVWRLADGDAPHPGAPDRVCVCQRIS